MERHTTMEHTDADEAPPLREVAADRSVPGEYWCVHHGQSYMALQQT